VADKAPRIESLTVFRFVAALIVVFFHYGRSVTGGMGILSAGPQMVTFFFVLSGTVMYLAHHHDDTRAGVFLQSRVARVAPVYLLALVFAIVAMIVTQQRVSRMGVLLSVAFLQAWISPYPLAINAPGWAISVEVFFYALFPLLLPAIQRRAMSATKLLWLGLGLWALTQATLSTMLARGFYAGHPSFSHDIIYYFPPFHLCSFVLGVAGGRWLAVNDARATPFWMAAPLALLAMGLTVMALGHLDRLDVLFGVPVAIGTSFLAPLFLALVVSIALVDSRIAWLLGHPLLVLLGEASYALYLLQEPLHMVFLRYVPIHLLGPQGRFYVFTCVLIALAILVHLKFERPAKAALLRAMKR
jgi:peptidoglycan/LPS O-acetylase OafA/YrhL